MTRLGIIGSRDWPNELVHLVMREVTEATELYGAQVIITGDADGVDECARVSTEAGTDPSLPCVVYCASKSSPRRLLEKEKPTQTSYVVVSDWEIDGKRAGRMRNRVLVAACTRVTAFTTGSPGTAHGIRLAIEMKIPLKVVTTDRVARTYLPDGTTVEERI